MHSLHKYILTQGLSSTIIVPFGMIILAMFQTKVHALPWFLTIVSCIGKCKKQTNKHRMKDVFEGKTHIIVSHILMELVN